MTSRIVAVGTLSLTVFFTIFGVAGAAAPANVADASGASAASSGVSRLWGIPVETAVWAVVGLIGIVAGLVAASKPARRSLRVPALVPADSAGLRMATAATSVPDLEASAPAA